MKALVNIIKSLWGTMDNNLFEALGQSGLTMDDTQFDMPLYDEYNPNLGAEMFETAPESLVPMSSTTSSSHTKETSAKETHKDRAEQTKDRSDKSKSEKTERSDRPEKSDKDRSATSSSSHKRHRDSKESAGKEESPKKPRKEDTTPTKRDPLKETKETKDSKDAQKKDAFEDEVIPLLKGRLEEATEDAVNEFRTIITDYKRMEILIKIGSALMSSKSGKSEKEKLEAKTKEVVSYLRALADKYEKSL